MGPTNHHSRKRSERVDLPEGVTASDWARERDRRQNPRLRCLLGCLSLLQDVSESNFALLHCSPKRLVEIWSRVRRVSATLRSELASLLGRGSLIPALEEAVQATAQCLAMLESSLLVDLDRVPARPPEPELEELRSRLCVALGQIQAFLADSLGQLLAADPRSGQVADYYLSKRFARDVDEAEWLYEWVCQLDSYLKRLEQFRPASLSALADHIAVEKRVPSGETWESAAAFLDELSGTLTPRLRRTVGLRGIRLDELEAVQGYAQEIPTLCRVVRELAASGQTTADRIERSSGAGSRSLAEAHEALSTCVVDRLRALDERLRDIAAFVPLWRSSLEQRRALLLNGTPKKRK